MNDLSFFSPVVAFDIQHHEPSEGGCKTLRIADALLFPEAGNFLTTTDLRVTTDGNVRSHVSSAVK